MFILADTHVHIYPSYVLADCFDSAFSNFNKIERKLGSTVSELKFLCLTEREDCHFFASLSSRVPTLGKYQVTTTSESNCLKVTAPNRSSLYILAGRQIISAERIEVLCLGADLPVKDGLALGDVIELIRESGAVAVLPWAPGKWFFKRGLAIRDIIHKYKPGEVLFADSSLRAWVWPYPHFLSKAAAAGFFTLAGSDPLPFAGEERQIARFASLLEGPSVDHQPALSLLNLLKDPPARILNLGTRSGLLQSLYRLLANSAQKRMGLDLNKLKTSELC